MAGGGERVGVCGFNGVPANSMRKVGKVLHLVSGDVPGVVILSTAARAARHLTKVTTRLFGESARRTRSRVDELRFEFVSFTGRLFGSRSVGRRTISSVVSHFQAL